MGDDEDGLVLADLTILEFYLHRSITLRLAHFPTRETQESQTALIQAYNYSKLINSIRKTVWNSPIDRIDLIEAVQARLGVSRATDIPMDEDLKQRFVIAAIIGNLFFGKHRDCPDAGPEFGLNCCSQHTLLSLQNALALAVELPDYPCTKRALSILRQTVIFIFARANPLNPLESSF